jgi:outer membrane cobalamin receptor
MGSSNTVLSFLIGSLLLPSTAYVQSDDPEEEQTPLTHPTFVEEVVVTGEIVAKTATVSVVTAEQIKAKGARTVAEALEFLPGANIRIGGSGQAYIRLRGFRQRETALLMDGVPVYSPYDGQLDLSAIPVDTIERIEVVKGASSVMYGPNAMGGVINIITKKSDGTQKTGLRGEYGSGESGTAGALIQGGVGKARYLVSGNFLNQEFYPLSGDYESQPNQGSGERANSDRRIWNGKLSFGWDMGERRRMSVNYSHIDQKRGIPHHESDKKARFLRYDDWQQGILDLIYDAELTRSTIKGKFYYEYLDNVLDRYDDIDYELQEGKNSYTETSDNYAVGGDLFYRYRSNPGLLLKSGLRFRYDHNDRQPDLGEDREGSSLNTLSVPLELEWTSAQRIDFTAGTSVDVFFFETGEASQSKTITAFNPQAALLVRATEKLGFKASAAHKTRFPTMRELFSSPSGNPELDPMSSNVFELGGNYALKPDLVFSLTGFYNDVKGLISRRNNTQPYQNVDRAVFAGVETGLDYAFNQDVSAYFFYTYMYSEDKSSDKQDSIEYRPEHKLDVAALLELPADFRLDAHLSAVSSQNYYDGEDEKKLDPYTLVDLKLSKAIAQRFEPYLMLRNLLDAMYYESEGFPREGRVILGGIQIDF